jgi:hypothetical protein
VFSGFTPKPSVSRENDTLGLPDKQNGNFSILTKRILLSSRVGEANSTANGITQVNLSTNIVLPSGGIRIYPSSSDPLLKIMFCALVWFAFELY